jgi:isopentenyl-diphosphate Delta-isomerase
MTTNQVFINLVDKDGHRIGKIEKIEAHQTGQLHEAFSVFIFNNKNELLLQKRNPNKYHSGGLWSNTCCSHAEEDEDIEIAVHRRLQEEMGFDCDLKELFTFSYKVNLENDFIENEFDHVFIGKSDEEPKPDHEEVVDYRWVKIGDLIKDIEMNPSLYTEWLKIIMRDERLSTGF